MKNRQVLTLFICFVLASWDFNLSTSSTALFRRTSAVLWISAACFLDLVRISTSYSKHSRQSLLQVLVRLHEQWSRLSFLTDLSKQFHRHKPCITQTLAAGDRHIFWPTLQLRLSASQSVFAGCWWSSAAGLCPPQAL